mgnify:CR=1 FL=1
MKTQMRFEHDPEGLRLPIKLDTATNGEYAPIPLSAAHHQARRAPGGDQVADLLETGRIVDGLDHGQGLGLAGQRVAHGNADPFDAEVEAQNDVDLAGAADLLNHYAWPASEASIKGSMPSSLMAAV